MATTLTLTNATDEIIASLARQRPGVTKHRMGLALLELGLETVQEEPDRLDARLTAMVEATGRSRRSKKEQP